jgi:hypothetical protein
MKIRKGLHTENEKIYNMLRTAEPTYTLKEWDEHCGKVEKIKQQINMIERRRH